jgi:hypothetical protein
MTPSYVRRRSTELAKAIWLSQNETEKLKKKLKKLQEDCKHVNREKRSYDETGYGARSYKYEVCLDCGLGKDQYR